MCGVYDIWWVYRLLSRCVSTCMCCWCVWAGLVHTDDRLALLEIVRQLDVKEDLGDKITVSNSTHSHCI